MTHEQIEQTRIDDIDFFAKRYTELFGKYFGVSDERMVKEFEESIREELHQKCPRYVIDAETCQLHKCNAIALDDGTYFANVETFGDQRRRIHEMFHQYNSWDVPEVQGLKGISGLKNFVKYDVLSGDLLKQMDEGSTEMFAKRMVGDEDTESPSYASVVPIMRLIECIVGEGTLIRATRGKPEILMEQLDAIMGQERLCQQIENAFKDADSHLQQYGDKIDLPDRFAEAALHANEYIRALRHPCLEEAFMAKIEKLATREEAEGLGQIIANIKECCRRFDYGFWGDNASKISARFREVCKDRFGETISDGIDTQVKLGSTASKTLAQLRQEYLLNEIETIRDQQAPLSIRDMVRIEIKKQIYDNITFTGQFKEKARGQKWMAYRLTDEDKERAKKFRGYFSDETSLLKFGGSWSSISALDVATFEPIDFEVGYYGHFKDKGGYLAARMNIDDEKAFAENYSDAVYEMVCSDLGREYDYYEGRKIRKEILEGITAVEKHIIDTEAEYRKRGIDTAEGHGAISETVLVNIESTQVEKGRVAQLLEIFKKTPLNDSDTSAFSGDSKKPPMRE